MLLGNPERNQDKAQPLVKFFFFLLHIVIWLC